MALYLRLGAIAAVAVAVALTVAQDPESGNPREPWGLAGHETTASLQPFRRSAASLPVLSELLPLSDEERSLVHAGVMRVSDAVDTDVAVPPLAAPLPAWVALHDLPVGVVGEIPVLRGYKFVKLNDRILLISPANRAVVGEIPRYRLLR